MKLDLEEKVAGVVKKLKDRGLVSPYLRSFAVARITRCARFNTSLHSKRFSKQCGSGREGSMLRGSIRKTWPEPWGRQTKRFRDEQSQGCYVVRPTRLCAFCSVTVSVP